MRFVEESEGAFSAAQLAAAERELEEQKKEWELGRLRALREEEERQMRLADDDEKPLTFGREDAQNQVNSTAVKGGSKRLVSKRLVVPSRRSSRRRGGNRVGRARIESSSESENETTSTESDSQEEDMVEDSLDEESSHTESQSQGDEEEEGEGGGGGEKEEEDDEEEEAGEESEDGRANDRDYSERGGGFSRRKGRLAGSGSSRNHFDLNSPRTRSRGNVQINLWTLDVSPILPGVKPNCRRQRKKFHRAKSEETLFSSSDTCSKRSVRMNMNAKVQSTNSQNTKTSEIAELKEDSTRNDMDSINLSSIEQRVANPNVERSPDDHADSLTSVAKTQSEQMKTSNSNSDNTEGSVKEKNDDKIVNGTNLITVCSVHVTRCSQKMLSATYRKFESEVNRNEDAENLDVNVSTRNSRSSPSAIQSDASLKRSKDSNKSKSEFGVSANSLCNNARGKLSAATSRESGSVESSSSRSVPLLRSKTLRNASPDAVDKISKPLAISRVSIAQRNSKTNVDDTRNIENENKDRVCDNDNDNAESISSTRKYTASQRYNSKSDTRENLNLNVASLQVSEKGTDDSVSNVSDSLIASSVKSESNSNESKYNIRRLEVALARSVTTRSSKIPSISNHSEESNCRLIDDKVESLSEAKSRSQAKMCQGTRRTDLTSLQPAIAEQSKTTRSIVPPLTSPPLTGGDEMTSSKLTPRRRPDTPLPRPVTRSAVIMNTSTRISPNRSEKYATRNSKQCQDNGLVNSVTPVSPVLFRRSKSIPPMKPDPKETSVMAKRRPDTPRPNIPPSYNEQVSRVTRSGLTSSASSAKSASSPLLPPATSALKASMKQPRISPTSSENETPTSLVSSSYEKPQRTAKVVAILSLDTRNHHNSNKTFSSIQSKSIANYETKGQDKELLPRLSPKDQDADREECDSSDIKSRRLRREMKRIKNTVSCAIEDERANSDDSSDKEPMQKRSFRSHLSLSSSSSTVVTTRSDKLRNATIS